MYHEVHYPAHKNLNLEPTRNYIKFQTELKIHFLLSTHL
jgi:hypothetical protein